MSKYIDADKLIEILEEIKQAEYENCGGVNAKTGALQEVQELIDSLQQEQPEVDLEKFTDKIKTFQGRYKHPEIVSIKGAMAFMARMFYQYPNVARQWYEQLPKATMD